MFEVGKTEVTFGQPRSLICALFAKLALETENIERVSIHRQLCSKFLYLPICIRDTQNLCFVGLTLYRFVPPFSLLFQLLIAFKPVKEARKALKRSGKQSFRTEMGRDMGKRPRLIPYKLRPRNKQGRFAPGLKRKLQLRPSVRTIPTRRQG